MYPEVSVYGLYSTTLGLNSVVRQLNGWGAYCTFYYKGQTARTTTAYMYVSAPAPTPTPQPGYGSMRGVAHEGGGGYAINLENGTEVFVDSWNCNVEGQFYDGCSAVVYYTDYPSTANVYRADIFGNMGLIVPDEDKGGWAGSNYYENEHYFADEDQGGWAGSNYYDNEPDYADEDQGGWAGSNYYDNEPDYADEDQGGWAGSNYYDNEPDYFDDSLYDPVGDEYNRVTCPLCGNHFSVGLDECPVCGWTP